MVRDVRYPILNHCLRFCKEVAPQACLGVIDIGVRYQTDFLIEVFPESFHYLFEPVVECYPKIHQAYSQKKIRYALFEMALTNVNQSLYLHQYSSDGSGKITHSEVHAEPQSSLETLHSVIPIDGRRLDDVVFTPGLQPLTYVIKLDVDGIEELIIEGGQRVVQQSSFVILEASVVRGNVLRRLQLMESMGFRLFDICDSAYYFNQLSCMDLVFINERLRSTELRFRPWEYAKWRVLWDKWQQGYPDLAKLPLPQVFP